MNAPFDASGNAPSNISSETAMRQFLKGANDLRRPHVAKRFPGLPTLQQLAMRGKEIEASGKQVIHQSAGDIDALKKPLSEALPGWIRHIRTDLKKSNGTPVFPHVAGEVFDGFSANYEPQYPDAISLVAQSIGIRKTPYKSLQTLSGRSAIDLAMMSMIIRCREACPGKQPVFIGDPLMWPGYLDLIEDYKKLHGNAFTDMIQTPAGAHGLTMSAEGVSETLEYAIRHDQAPAGIIIISPSNPTGLSLDKEELKKILTLAAAHDIPVFIDAFYAPLAEDGHEASLPLAELEDEMTPGELAYLGVMYGSTKTMSSKHKVAEIFWLAPKNHDQVAKELMQEMHQRMINRNLYPRPGEVIAEAALHTFPDGLHTGMGPRYTALEATRGRLKKIFDDLEMPFSTRDSFYGTVALADASSGETYLRDAHGRPLTSPVDIAHTLVNDYGLVGAPGAMFSSSSDATPMLRLSAAASEQDIAELQAIFTRMKEHALRHG